MILEIFFLPVLLFPLITSYHDYKDKEVEVTLEIFKALNIGHCILVVDNLQSIILNHKEIYDDHRFIAHIQKEHLKYFLDHAESVYMRIGFVINIDVIDVLKDFFQSVSIFFFITKEVKPPFPVCKLLFLAFLKPSRSASVPRPIFNG